MLLTLRPGRCFQTDASLVLVLKQHNTLSRRHAAPFQASDDLKHLKDASTNLTEPKRRVADAKLESKYQQARRSSSQ